MAKKTPNPAAAAGGSGAFRDRIREYKRIRSADLVANPLNWRQHPENQQNAMRGILEEVGIVDALLVRDRSDGTYDIIDGHLRASLMPEDEVPCLVLDVDEDEARKILLTFDPLGAMAEANAANLNELLRDAEFGAEALQELVNGLAENAGLYVDETGEGLEGDAEGDGQYTTKIEAPIYTPKGERPAVSELTDCTKAEELCAEIQTADLPAGIKEFLLQAAQRHVVYNFRNIAEFYCHATAEVQHLMERSGLIIIDMDKAIANGFVHLSERLGAIADLELSEAEDA
jgi:hypothetical protein